MSDTIDTSQGINVGDAVLQFLGDTTQLDQAFDRVATEAEVKMAGAADSVSKVGDAVDGVTASMAVGQQGAVKLGEFTTLAGEKTRASMYEARGETQLLGEMFGVHLPRHVRSFVAELPGVGSALSAAFSATAILFLLDALIKGSEKLSEWISNTFIFTQAMKDSDASTVKFNETLAKFAEETAKHQKTFDDFGKSAVTLAHEKLGEITKALAENKKAFEAASKTATEYARADSESFFEKMEARIALINRWLGVELDADETAALAREEFDKKGIAGQEMLILKAKEKADLDLQWANADHDNIEKITQAAESAANKQASIDETLAMAKIKRWAALAKYEALFAQDAAGALLKIQQEQADKEYQLKLRTLEKEKAAQQAALSGYEFAGDDVASKKQIQLVAETNAKIEALNAEHYVKSIDQMKAANDAYATKAVEAAKIALDAQLKGIEDFKKAQLDLYVAGKAGIGSWEAAQVHAADAAAIAHQDYLKKVIAVYAEQGEAQKAQSARQELAALQTEAEAKATERLSAAMEKLTSATKEAKEAEQKLAEDTISQHFKDQETAITKLAEMHLITEEQKDDRLKLLEQQQASEALAILDASLKAQQKLRDEAEAKLNAAKANPATTKSELTDLQAELTKEVAAVAKAEDAKLQAQEKFNQVSEANDKSHYGRALLLAMAYGAEMLAEQLKQNHGDLLAAENQLKQAKARGDNTDAIHRQIEALKLHEKELEKEANGDKAAILAEEQITRVKLLAAQSILAEAKARGLDTTAIEKEIRDLQLLLKQQQLEVTQLPKMTTAMHGLEQTTQQLGGMMQKAGEQMDQAFAKALMGALQSGKSIGAALEAATKQVLDNLAEQAMAQAIYCTAMGIAELATGVTSSSAAEWFAAAAEFGLVAGVAGGIGMAIPGAGGGSSGGQTGPTPGQTQNANVGGSSGGGPVGVTKLATGGVVNRKIMIGDSPSGGDASEAILPLSDPNAMRQIASALAPQGQPQPTPQEEARYDPQGIDRMLEAISALTGMRQATNEPGRNFTFAPPATGAAPGFQFSGSTASGKRDFSSGSATVGERLGFDLSQGSGSEKPSFVTSPGSSPTSPADFTASAPSASADARPFGKSQPATVGEALGFDTAAPSVSGKPEFASRAASASASQDFQFAEGTAPATHEFPAPQTPTVANAPVFPQSVPASPTEKAPFAFAPAAGQAQAPEFGKSSATVGAALGFDGSPSSAQTPTPEFRSATSPESAAQSFRKTPASIGDARSFTSIPSTVGEALGFDRNPAIPQAATPEFQSAPSIESPAPIFNSAAQPEAVEPSPFATAAPSPSGSPSFESSPSTVGEALGFTSAQPSATAGSARFASGSPRADQENGFTAGQPSASTGHPPISAAQPSVSAEHEFNASESTATPEKRGFNAAPPSSASPVPSFTSSAGTVGEALGFASAAPSSTEKPQFSRSEGSGSEASRDFRFSAASAAASPVTAAIPPAPTAPSPSVVAGFSSEEPSASEKAGFAFAALASTQAPAIEKPQAQTVGEALGFTSAPASATEKPSFERNIPSASAAQGYQFTGTSTVGEALGFDRAPATPTPVTPATSSNTPTVGEALGFTSAEPSPIEKRNYDRGPATPSDKPSFDAAPKSASQSAGLMFAKSPPSAHEAAGFTSGEPAPGEKPSFDFSEPTESEKAQFLASQPSVSAKPGFETATSSPTVGEALGFKFDTPYPGDKPVFSSGQPSAPEKPGFSLAAPSANEQRDFTAASPQTVGQALGFDFSAPRTSYEGLGFTSGQPSGTATRGFSSGVPSPHEKQPLDIEPSTPGERPGFNYSAPSIPREMPDMEALAANFGGLLSTSTLRSASNSQAPSAAVAAGSSVTPMDVEARMEKFAARLGSQMSPEGKSSAPSSAGGDTHVHVNVKGMLSPDNLNKVVKKINRAVANRQITLNASNSQRLTRRSQ